MSNTTYDWIHEIHTPRWVLPNEEIVNWIKYDPQLEFDTIEIKLEADLAFLRMLNIDEKVFEQDGIKLGFASIDKKLIQINGFVGFTCKYELIPENERKISFIVDFKRHDTSIGVLELKTQLVRPMLAISNESIPEIDSTKDNFIIHPLTFALRNVGTGRVVEVSPFIEFSGPADIKVSLEERQEKYDGTEELFVPTIFRNIAKMIITGKGYGMITMGFEYNDPLGNKYKTNVVQIPIILKQKENLAIPIYPNVSGQASTVLIPRSI